MNRSVDCVIIGLNSAKTLGQCIQSVQEANFGTYTVRIIYVDGGSTDDSPRVAEQSGVEILPLMPEHPAPGLQRNAGWRHGSAEYVLFLDADTLLHPDFPSTALNFLADQANGDVAAFFGNREEQHPDASVFNWIGNLEWNPPAGDVEAFGGDVLIRRSVLEQTNGYDEVLVGGEDPELGVRVRLAGWRIRHENLPMTRHDLNSHSLKSHARRAFRTGYGYAAVATRHWRHARGFWVYELGRICSRGGGFYALSLLGLLLGGWAGLLSAAAGLFLLLYPRIFSVSKFMNQKTIPRPQARTYAWHCTLVVLPQMLGVLRYIIGLFSGSPLRNKAPLPPVIKTILFMLVITTPLCSCGTRVEPEPTLLPTENATQQQNSTMAEERGFTVETQKLLDYAAPAAIEEFSKEVPGQYLLGPGDQLSIQVWGRDELNDPDIIVAPDGSITIMRIGFVQVRGRTLPDVTDEISQRLSTYYSSPEVRLSIRKYRNNKAFVLGRVALPGVVEFSGKGTLLEALSLAGGLPTEDSDAFLSKCAIIRGKNQVIWVDLRDLLNNGNMALNANIQNGDIIFIPESEDELVYVMGEVEKPGAIRLKSRLTYLDALMYAGGPTRDADLEKTFIIRFNGDGSPNNGTVKAVNLKTMLEQGDGSNNYILRDNDVVYISETGMANFNYHMLQLLPTMEVLNLGTSVLERFGVMQDIRGRLYGTTGFVNGN